MRWANGVECDHSHHYGDILHWWKLDHEIHCWEDHAEHIDHRHHHYYCHSEDDDDFDHNHDVLLDRIDAYCFVHDDFDRDRAVYRWVEI